ncbi:MAG: efflux RND transporter permease subunit [Pseudomonadota bacterium]
MNGLIDAAFARTRVILTALVVLFFTGLGAFNAIPREAEPDIAAPFVVASIPLPGISPEDAERLLIRPSELEVQTIEGLSELNTLAYDGAAQIIAEFETNVDMETALLNMREAMDRAQAEFPTDAEEPVVQEFNAQNQFPILTVILAGDAPERAIYQAARRLKDRLESLSGVLDAKLTGARDELLEVIVDPEVLESYGLREVEVASAIRNNNQLVAAGSMTLDDGRFSVKSPGLVRNAADVMAIPVRVNGDNIVTVGDVAEVRRTFVDRTGYAIFNGQPAIGVELSKRAGANIIETIEAAREITQIEAKNWPSSINHQFINDRSVNVRDNLEGLTSSVITAVLLVMIVIVGALGARSALMVGIAIPTSFLIGFLLLTMMGFTLNMMVMFALVLAVGMLVDGAIVVVEYADRRMTEGADRAQAYKEASKRMFWPVATSTATTLAAFFPFLFWDDIAGKFMKFLPITLIFVLLASLVVALIFLPVLGSVMGLPKWLKTRLKIEGKTDGPRANEIDEINPTTIDGPIGVYARQLQNLIRRPLLVFAGVGATIFGCVTVFQLANPDLEYFIRGDQEEINILVLARGNLSPKQQIAIVQEVGVLVADHPAIENIYAQTGPGFSRGDDFPAETIGQVGIDLISYSEREHSTKIMQEFRELTADVPGVVVEVRQREGGPPVGKDIQVEISAANFDEMLQAARKLRAFLQSDLSTIAGRDVLTFMDIEDTMPLPGIEWAMQPDRTLAGRYGLSVQEAGAMMQFVTTGLLVDKYRPDDSEEEIDIRARFPEDYRTITSLDRVRVQTPQGSVPLSNFIVREPRPQIDRIARRDGRRVIEVKANGNTRIAGHEVSQDLAIARTREYLESGALGDVSWSILGADEETAAAATFFTNAMIAAMFTIAMILLMEFNSFYHAILTLTAVVLSVFGVLLGIALSGQYVSVIMTGVGIVALAGIVVNNNIVLIDTYQHLRRKGLAVEDAVVRTAAQRIRPVLLTTGTTILGLLPMVFELNVDFAAGTITRGSTTSDWWVLLSSAVVYGLAFSTVLTLVLTPVLLAAPTVLGERIKNLREAKDTGAGRVSPAPERSLQPAAPTASPARAAE